MMTIVNNAALNTENMLRDFRHTHHIKKMDTM